MAIRHLSNNNADGTLLSQSTTDKLGAFGKTPIVQPTGVTGTTNAASQSTALIGASVTRIIQVLVDLGWMSDVS